MKNETIDSDETRREYLRSIQFSSEGFAPLPEYISENEFEIDENGALLTGLKVSFSAASKTFSFNPWILRATDGTVLATVNEFKVTFVRAIDPVTGAIACFETISYFMNANGWLILEGTRIHSVPVDVGGGAFEDWDAGTFQVNCGDSGAFKFHRKDFRPDWFDIVSRVRPYASSGKWGKCR